jgi:antitoxin PrlF
VRSHESEKKRGRLMNAYASKLTKKFQATVPLKVRRHLHLKQGDRIVYEMQDDNTVVIRKMTSVDLEYLNAVSETLNEWNSDADERAYKDL